MTENKNDPKYDYEGYTKSLEKVLEGVTKDYWVSYVDINRHQIIVGQNYLWASVTLIGIYIACFKLFKLEIIESQILVILGFISMIFALSAFGVCLYVIPARKGYKTIPQGGGWGTFSHIAYNLLNEKSKNLYTAFLTELISKVDNAFEYNLKTNKKRAYLLRMTSWLLIISFLTGVVAASGATYNVYYKNKTKEIKIMTREYEPTSNQTSESENEAPEVPIPPPPADVEELVHDTIADPKKIE